MAKFLFFCSFLCFVSANAQAKKKDSAGTDKKVYQYTPRIFYPYDCSCPGKIIYKELKTNDKGSNPYPYKDQKPIIIDSTINKKSRADALPVI